MVWYEIVAGKYGNDYDNYGNNYRSLDKALRVAKQLEEYAYVRVDKHEGDYSKLGGYDGDYIDTVFEKKIKS